jgi:hypothetical protein
MDPIENRKKVLQEVLDRLLYTEGFLDALEKLIKEHPIKDRKINYDSSTFKIPESQN